jgi:hypothetical protein
MLCLIHKLADYYWYYLGSALSSTILLTKWVSCQCLCYSQYMAFKLVSPAGVVGPGVKRKVIFYKLKWSSEVLKSVQRKDSEHPMASHIKTNSLAWAPIGNKHVCDHGTCIYQVQNHVHLLV